MLLSVLKRLVAIIFVDIQIKVSVTGNTNLYRYEYLDTTFKTFKLHEHYIILNTTPWLFNGYFQKLVLDLKTEVKKIHEDNHRIGGFRHCMYMYVDLKYFNSLKTL